MSESPEFIASSAASSGAFSRAPTASASESPPDYAPPDDRDYEDPFTIDAPTSVSAPVAEKPFHSKRPHKKSRAGCKNCKARKVKCDEVRPTCRSCRLRKAECVYPELPQAAAASSATASSTSTARQNHKASVRHAASATATSLTATASATTTLPYHTPPQQSALTSTLFTDPVLTSFNPDDDLTLTLPDDPSGAEDFGDPAFDATTPLIVVHEPIYKLPTAYDDTEMRLMWWYTAETSMSFSLSADKSIVTPGVGIMRTQLVQHAFRTPFLMDSLYALTSLHLSELDPSGSTVDPRRAMMYRQRSYLGYRKAIETADPATFPALLSNSLLMCALSSQTFRDEDAPDLYIIDWMVVWKGIGLIVDLISVPGLVESGLQALFYRPQVNLDEAAAAVPNHLLFMISSIPDSDPEKADSEAYYAVLKHLGSLFSNLRTGGINPIMCLRIITAFTFVSTRFVELARLRRPRTLVILAYYAMFFKLIPVVWWTVGIGKRSLKDLCTYLGPDWHHLLRAPMMAIHVEDPIAIARLLLEDPTWESPGAEHVSEVEKEVRNLSWVDNAGRRMVFQPDRNRMVAKEFPDGPDLMPYFEDKCRERYQMQYEVLSDGWGDSPVDFSDVSLETTPGGGNGQAM